MYDQISTYDILHISVHVWKCVLWWNLTAVWNVEADKDHYNADILADICENYTQIYCMELPLYVDGLPEMVKRKRNF